MRRRQTLLIPLACVMLGAAAGITSSMAREDESCYRCKPVQVGNTVKWVKQSTKKGYNDCDIPPDGSSCTNIPPHCRIVLPYGGE